MSSIPEPWNKLFKILMLELGEQKNKYNKQHNEYEEYIKTLINSAKSSFGFGGGTNDADGDNTTPRYTNNSMPYGPWSPTTSYDIWGLGILIFELVFGRTPPAYGHVLQTKLQKSRLQGQGKTDANNNVSVSHYDFLSSLKSWGFNTSQYNKTIKGTKNLDIHHKKFEEKRYSLDYDIDGLVYKVNKLDLQNRLGFVANAPRWAVAHKFSANSSVSKILNIDIQVGRTGALTPVAKIEPVNIGGVVVSNATLHTEDEINRKDIRVGDTVKVERAGDVIPHVVSVDKTKRAPNSVKYIFPEKCPSCGSKTVKDFNESTKKYDAVRRCPNEDFKCEKIAMECLKHFVSKEALNIDGFGKKILEKFWEFKLVKLPHDIFSLDFKKIEELDGWGELSVSNLKYAIEKSKTISLDRFIYALGIRHIGKENAKLLAQHLKNIENFYKLLKNNDLENLSNIDGIGETQIKSVGVFLSYKTNLTVIEKLKKIMKISNAISTKKDGILKNKTFMFTGKLKEISRAEAKSLVEQNSGKIISNVNKKLNYLVIGEKSTSGKIKKAKELNIKMLTQVEWIKMLDKTS